MAVIEGRTTLKSYFETGDKPTQDQFARFIESVVLLPVNATGSDVGAAGFQLLQASTTASALGQLGAGQVGTALFGAATTAAALNTLGLSNTEVISGQIEVPVTGQYVLDQRAAYAFTVDWISYQTVSGQAQITAKIDGTNIAGMASAAADTTEGAASATSNNAVAIGQTLRLDISGVSGAAKLSFTIKTVRT